MRFLLQNMESEREWYYPRDDSCRRTPTVTEKKQRSYLNLYSGIRFAYNGFLQGLTLLNQSKNAAQSRSVTPSGQPTFTHNNPARSDRFITYI